MAVAVKEAKARQDAIDRRQEEENENNDLSDVVLNDDAMVGLGLQE